METIKEMIAFIFLLDRDTFANEQRVKWIKVIYMIYRVLMSILMYNNTNNYGWLFCNWN